MTRTAEERAKEREEMIADFLTDFVRQLVNEHPEAVSDAGELPDWLVEKAMTLATDRAEHILSIDD